MNALPSCVDFDRSRYSDHLFGSCRRLCFTAGKSTCCFDGFQRTRRLGRLYQKSLAFLHLCSSDIDACSSTNIQPCNLSGALHFVGVLLSTHIPLHTMYRTAFIRH